MEQLLASKEFVDRRSTFRPYTINVQSIGGYSLDFLIAD